MSHLQMSHALVGGFKHCWMSIWISCLHACTNTCFRNHRSPKAHTTYVSDARMYTLDMWSDPKSDLNNIGCRVAA
jgi:hypothetical protein